MSNFFKVVYKSTDIAKSFDELVAQDVKENGTNPFTTSFSRCKLGEVVTNDEIANNIAKYGGKYVKYTDKYIHELISEIFKSERYAYNTAYVIDAGIVGYKIIDTKTSLLSNYALRQETKKIFTQPTFKVVKTSNPQEVVFESSSQLEAVKFAREYEEEDVKILKMFPAIEVGEHTVRVREQSARKTPEKDNSIEMHQLYFVCKTL